MTYISDILIFCTGLISGALLYRLFFINASEAKNLSKALDETQAEYANYQQNVDLYFRKSAKLFGQLTQSYSEVHQHLSEGAKSLSHQPAKENLLANNKENLPTPEKSSDPA